MKTTWKTIIGAALVVSLSGCAAATIQPQPIAKLSGDTADYGQRKNYFFWGLAGEHRIDVTEVCPAGPAQMQAITTPVDGLLGFVTLGIYAPRTARIWCDNTDSQASVWHAPVDVTLAAQADRTGSAL